MGILNSTGQVIKNRKKFKEWEEQDNDKQAKREALYQKKHLDEETLKKAAAKGKVIMDVVDIMDTHSEEVAENTETAVMPIAQLAPVVALYGSIAGVIALGWKKIKNIAQKFSEFNETPQGEKYSKLYLDLSCELPYDVKGMSFWDKIKFACAEAFPEYFNSDLFKNINAGEKNEKISNLVEQIIDLKNAKENKELFDGITLKSLKIPKFAKASLLAITGITAGVFVLSNVLGTKLQVRASRIARWQSREDLKNPKYFVQYTPEQIAQAQKNLEENKEEKEISFKGKLAPMGGGLLGGGLFVKKDEDNFEKRNKGFIKTLASTIKDNKNYKEWYKSYNPQDKKVKHALSEEEIIEAQKDKEVIQRITKKINNNAEEYSEDMEVASGVIIGGTPFLGLGVSSLLNLIINKTGLAKKGEDKAFNKALEGLSESRKKSLKETREAFKKITEASGSEKTPIIQKLNAFNNFSSEILDSTVVRKNGKINLLETLSKGFNFIKSTKYSRNILIGITGTVLTTIAGAFIGLKLQKSSARAGRFKAKQEIQNDPRNFVGYSEKDFEEVKDVKGKKKTFGEKVKETVTFIPRVIGDYIEYEKYRKTEAKEDEKLLNELIKVDVSEEQINEAKDLQRKIFTTFENVDDKSQEYSESIEALNEMAMPIIPYIGMGAAFAPILIALVSAHKKGAAGVTEAITGFLAKHTKMLNGKTSKKILHDISENATKITAESQEVGLGKLISNLISQAKTNAAKKGGGNEIEELFKIFIDNEQLKNINLADLEKTCGFKLATDLKAGATLSDFISEIIAKNPQLIKINNGKLPDFTEFYELLSKAKEKAGKNGNTLNEFINLVAADKKYAKYLQFKASDIIDEFTLSQIPEQYSAFLNMKLCDLIKLSKGKVPNLKIDSSIVSSIIQGSNANIKAAIVQGDLRKMLQKLNSNHPIASILRKIANSKMTDEQALRIYQNIETIIKNIPTEDLNNIVKCVNDAFKKNPVDFMKAVKSGKLKDIIASKTAIKIGAYTGATWTALSFILTYALESAFASMQKNAGKLGVMTALEDLNDEKYYANENIAPKQKNTTPAPNTTLNNSKKPQSEMLKKILAERQIKQ